MTGDEFASLHRQLGLQVINTGTYNWIINENKTALSCPPEMVVFPTDEEITQVFRQGVRAISFRTEIDEKNFFEYLYEGTSYNLEQFDRKVRNRVKKGINSCSVRTPDLKDLVTQGLKINQQTIERQVRDEQYLTVPELWERFAATLYDAKDVYVRGAYVDGILAAYAVFMRVNDTYYVYYPYMDREYTAHCPMNAIYFTFINDRIESEGKIRISAGLSSYIEKKDLDRFKTNMLFEMVPCSRVLVISPRIVPLINPLGIWLLQKAAALNMVESRLLTQYEILYNSKGMYRQYLNERLQAMAMGSESPVEID